MDDGNFPSPLKAFAGYIFLQLVRDVVAEFALRAAGGWKDKLLMRLNLEQGKSMKLIEHVMYTIM